MAKVKKGAGLTGVRNAKASKRKPAKTGGKKSRSGAKTPAMQSSASGRKKGKSTPAPKKRSSAKPAARRTPAGGRAVSKSKLTLTRGGTARTAKAVPAPRVRASIRELDPQRKCGPGTTVQFLYRVDLDDDRGRSTHLVFLDRHGWYCEHGRACPAVGYAKKHNGQIARVS